MGLSLVQSRLVFLHTEIAQVLEEIERGRKKNSLNKLMDLENELQKEEFIHELYTEFDNNPGR